ncbi:MAG: hypothetical protein J4F28_08920 [Nitrosopumilaceae archaeon]|nr:hypothetical protein [Nitrosopumilaceae archaeon]
MFNSSQRLYIVGEGIEQKTADICTYLSQNRIKISCISMGFFGDNKDDIRAVHTDMVTEDQDENGFDKWDYSMKHGKTDIVDAINDVISHIETDLGCHGEISESAATCTFYTNSDYINGIRFAVIYAYKTKDY